MILCTTWWQYMSITSVDINNVLFDFVTSYYQLKVYINQCIQ